MAATMGSRLRPLGNEASAFLRWWLRELVGLLPDAWQRRLQLGRDDLVLQSRGGRCRVERRSLVGEEQLASWDCTREDDVDLKAVLDKESLTRLLALRKNCRTVLEFDDSAQVLRRDILLPLAALDNLSNVLGYEMDRHTPFTASQVFFGYRVLERRPATAQVQVRLVAIPRGLLESWLVRLERWSLYPDRIAIADEPGVDLMPAERRRRRQRLPGTGAVLTAAAAGLAAMLVIMPLWVMRDVNRALSTEIQRLQPQALEVERLRDRRGELLAELSQLVQKKAEYPPLTDSLVEMARLIPDHSWFSSLQYTGSSLIVHGQSQSASGLITLIESSPYFERSVFVAPVSRDNRGLDNFQLSTQLRPRERMEQDLGSGIRGRGSRVQEANS